MAETGNIEELAKKVSNDIFKWFKWNASRLTDVNSECVTEHHNKKTHPSDVVFYYNDPYSGRCIYLNTDLKSYAKNTINTAQITGALKSLSLSVECANVSESWATHFILDSEHFDKVIGVLFIYNHDGDYHHELSKMISTIDLAKIPMGDEVKLVVIDPLMIQKLLDVVTDMKGLTADNLLPNKKDYTFFYPDLVRSRLSGDEWEQPASIEALTAPWLIIKHRETDEIQEGYLIYYHSLGATVEEFIYLIDAMSHYQILLSKKIIRVRFTKADDLATVNFDKAKIEYLKIWGNDDARKKQLDKIDATHINNYSTKFSAIEVGMERHE